MNYKNIVNKISLVLVVVICIQLVILKPVAAEYPDKNIQGKLFNQAMTTKAGFGIYGIESNGTGVVTGVIPIGMTVPQSNKEGEWRYFGYNYDNNVITNPSYPGEYGEIGTKIGNKSWTWNNSGFDPNDVRYSKETIALNEDSGDKKSANQIGIDYCELIELATPNKPGAFRVWFETTTGRTMYMTYVIPQNNKVPRHSFVYFREEGTQKSLLSNKEYEQYTYSLSPGQTQNLSWSAKDYVGYEFTRSITSTNTSNGFENELTGDVGKTRQGTLNYNSSNEFDVIFYYRPVIAVKTLNIKHVSYDPSTDKEISIFEDYSIDIKKGDPPITESAKSFSGYEFLKYQNSNSSYYSGVTSTNLDFNFSFDDFGSSNEHYIRFMYIKDNSSSSLIGEILTDNSSYTCKSSDTSVTIQAKEKTDLNIEDVNEVKEIGAKVTSYSINGGSNIVVNKIKTSSITRTIETEYAALNINITSLKEGTNNISIKGYSWWKDKLENIKEVSTVKTVTVTVNKIASSKPIAVIEAPKSTHVGNTVEVKGIGSDPTGLAITEYLWTSTNGQVITGTSGNITVISPVTLTLKVKNSANVWSDVVTHTINIENNPPKAIISAQTQVLMGDDLNIEGNGIDPDGDELTYNWEYSNNLHNSNLNDDNVISNKKETVWFSEVGEENLSFKVVDPSGLSDTASKIINVLPPIPEVVLNYKGKLKVNRKITIYSTGTSSKRYPLEPERTTWEIKALSGISLSDIKTLLPHEITKDSNGIDVLKITGDYNSIDILSKKQGQISATCTMFNNANYSGFSSKTIDIKPDLPPIAKTTTEKHIIRNPNDLSVSGKAQFNITVNDLSNSTDDDFIFKRAYIVVFDTNEDSIFDNEMSYVYDIDYNQTGQIPKDDSLNPHLRPIGLFKDINFDINKFNVGNLSEITIKSTLVGTMLVANVVEEDIPDSETILQFISDDDKLKSNTLD